MCCLCGRRRHQLGQLQIIYFPHRHIHTDRTNKRPTKRWKKKKRELKWSRQRKNSYIYEFVLSIRFNTKNVQKCKYRKNGSVFVCECIDRRRRKFVPPSPMAADEKKKKKSTSTIWIGWNKLVYEFCVCSILLCKHMIIIMGGMRREWNGLGHKFT